MLVSFCLPEPVDVAADTESSLYVAGCYLHNWQCTVIGDGVNVITCRDMLGLKPSVIGQGY